jgi:hypothetical protein
MAVHVTKISLDFHAEAPKQRIVTAKQYDSGRVVECMLFSNGVSYIIPEGAYVRIRMKKPDGTYIYNYCEVSNDTVTFVITNQATAVTGTVLCDLEVDINNEIVSTVSFTMEVYPIPYSEDAVESSSEMNAIDQKFADINNSVAEAKDWAYRSEATSGIHIASYTVAGIVKLNPETMSVDEYGVINPIGAVADESTFLLHYGFVAVNTVFNSDDSITETDSLGYKRTTVFNSDGSITEYIYSPQNELLRTKTTTFNSNGNINETVTISS